VTRERHAAHGLDTTSGYAFARRIDRVPVVAAEFGFVCKEAPIVFFRSGDSVVPTAILGDGPDQNKFVSANGKWTGKYIPAQLRRYPFILAKTDKEQKYALCVEESYPGFAEQNDGRRLFADDGTETPFLREVMGFLTQHQSQAVQTERFCKTVLDLGLLVPARLGSGAGNGSEERGAPNILVASREKIKGLAADKLETLLRSDYLELLFQHLVSIAGILRQDQK